MALSLSPQTRDRLTSLLICISLGNLCFLRRWYDLEHLKERTMDYYRMGPADETLLWSTLTAAFLMAAVMWCAWLWVQRNPTPGRMKFAQCFFLLLLVFPLESVRRYWNDDVPKIDLTSNIAVLLIESILAAGVILTIMGNLRIVRAARRVVLMLTLLFPSLMIDFSLSRMNAEPAEAYQPKPTLPFLPQPAGPPHRVIWLLFDEFDQRLAFDDRQPTLEMPELDRLRAESFVGNQATQTAGWTILAMPSLLSGRVYSRAELVDSDTLKVYPEGSREGFNWREQPNVFKTARSLGVNAELVGWHHPYCRVFGDSTVRCFDIPGGHPTAALLRELSAEENGFSNTVGFLFRLQVQNLKDMLHESGMFTSENMRSAFVQKRQQKQYFEIRDRTYAAAVDPKIQFLFAHFPAPHLFAIYDRKRRDFTLSNTTGYFDNLALVDRTVGELRQTLEKAGMWESTSIVITADHGLRPELWRGRYNWTEELDRLTKDGQSPKVPFIVKLAGQTQPLVYDKQFSNVVTADLSLAILKHQVTTASEAAAWIDSFGERAAVR